MVLDHRLAVPDDPTLNAHSDAAAWRDSERGRFLSKGRTAGKMDLIRAGSMATWELVSAPPPKPPARKAEIFSF